MARLDAEKTPRRSEMRLPEAFVYRANSEVANGERECGACAA